MEALLGLEFFAQWPSHQLLLKRFPFLSKAKHFHALKMPSQSTSNYYWRQINFSQLLNQKLQTWNFLQRLRKETFSDLFQVFFASKSWRKMAFSKKSLKELLTTYFKIGEFHLEIILHPQENCKDLFPKMIQTISKWLYLPFLDCASSLNSKFSICIGSMC